MFTPPVDMRVRGGFTQSALRRPVFATQLEGGDVQSMSSDNNVQPVQYLWGTSISMGDILGKVRTFFVNFKEEDSESVSKGENLYIARLLEIKNCEIFVLNVSGIHIHSFDKQLYVQLINYPTEMIPIMDTVASQIYNELYTMDNHEQQHSPPIQVRITDLVNKSRIRDLSPNDIDKLICITGLTIRNSDIIPEMREAYFKCAVCEKIEHAELQRSKIVEPNDCKNCKSKFSFELIHNRSVYSDKQHVKLQETPEHMPEGETPLTIHLCCYDELVDFVKPGDRCEVVGIFRAQGLRVNPRKRVTKSIYRIYVDVVSFSKSSKKRLVPDEEDFDQGDSNLEHQENIRKQIHELAKHPDIYNILVDSFAPSIWENEDVKKGLLLQLFGGVSKDITSTGRGRFRGDINVLLVGDPSTAKSQLLQFTHNLAPRGIYTSGKVNYKILYLKLGFVCSRSDCLCNKRPRDKGTNP